MSPVISTRDFLSVPAAEKFVRQIISPLRIVEHDEHRAIDRSKRIKKPNEGLNRSRLARFLGSHDFSRAIVENA